MMSWQSFQVVACSSWPLACCSMILFWFSVAAAAAEAAPHSTSVGQPNSWWDAGGRCTAHSFHPRLTQNVFPKKKTARMEELIQVTKEKQKPLSRLLYYYYYSHFCCCCSLSFSFHYLFLHRSGLLYSIYISSPVLQGLHLYITRFGIAFSIWRPRSFGHSLIITWQRWHNGSKKIYEYFTWNSFLSGHCIHVRYIRDPRETYRPTDWCTS